MTVGTVRRAALWGILLLLGGVLLPSPASAKILGIVYPETCTFYEAATDALKKHLAANGFGPDRLEISVQKPSADPMSWANSLRKLSGADVDLIAVWGDGLLETACRERLRVPLEFGFVVEPGLFACARSAGNPSGTAVGVSSKTPLHALLSKARLMTEFKTIGVLSFPGDRAGQALIEEVRRVGTEQGFVVEEIAAKIGGAADALRAAPTIGLFILPGCSLVAAQTEALLAAAAELRIPTVSLQPPRGAAAALLSLYASPEEQGRLAGEIAVQILSKGFAAAPTAPLLPKNVELEINLPLARRLGLKVPMALLESATKVIK